MPQRIQRKRTRGWRMPEGAVYVGRPTKWGNPFTVINGHRQGWLVYDDRSYGTSSGFIASFPTCVEAHRHAVKLYRRHMHRQWDLTPLRGRDLMCFCPLDRPCHADILLEIANA